MKKLIPLLLALTLLLSLGGAALADDDEGQSHKYTKGDNKTLDQKITTTIPEGKIKWHLEIPADVTITKGGYDEGREDVKEVKIVIDEGELNEKQQIEAYLQYTGIMYLENKAEKYKFQLSVKTPENDGTWDGYATLETGKDHNVGIKTKDKEQYDAPDAWIKTDDWIDMPQGNYTGTITYSSKLVDKG